MDQILLVRPDMARAGDELLLRLEAKGVHVSAALWLHDPEAGRWKFLVATEDAKRNLTSVYLKVSEILLSDRSLGSIVSSSEVEIVPPDHLIVRLLREAFGENVSTATPWHSSTVNGTMIEDALIYRLAA
jgi:hypothetical protein